MADDQDNHLTGPSAGVPGDVPEPLRRRYLTDPRGGPGVGFFVDAATAVAAFRDEGRRLSTPRNDPRVIRDLVEIARHRGWTAVTVQGSEGFRREAWLVAQAAGLEVRGYRPSVRDRQLAERRAERERGSPSVPRAPAPDPLRDAGAQARLRVVEETVRSRVAEPAVRDRIVEHARARLADWLERGARFEPPRAPDRPRQR